MWIISLKICFIIVLIMGVCAHERSEEANGSGVPGGGELPGAGAENQTWVLHKTDTRS